MFVRLMGLTGGVKSLSLTQSKMVSYKPEPELLLFDPEVGKVVKHRLIGEFKQYFQYESSASGRVVLLPKALFAKT